MNKPNTISDIRPKFWEKYDLTELTKPEWEALCDGCGKCCMIKLEDETIGSLQYTNVACRLFDDNTCQCSHYLLRQQMVSGCVTLTPENIERCAYWMPSTCTYRLLYEEQPLPKWHPLISGTKDTVINAGISVKGKTISETDIHDDDLEDYIIEGFQ